MSDIKIYNMDCMELLKDTPDNAYELAICDPPYGSDNIIGGYLSNKGGGVARKNIYHTELWNQSAPSKFFFNELLRVSKNQIIWGANHFISKIPIDSSCWIVWDKDNAGHFADSELAYTSFDTAVRNFKWKWSGMLQQNMKNKQKRIHPTEKPIQLYEWLLMNYAKEGDKILDTHLGSGSIAIACHNLGFHLTACELDKEYYEAAIKRLKQHQAQLRMF